MSRVIRNCPVAVVGGAGFLGSHLVNHLIDERSCSVLVVDNLVAGRSEFIHPGARFVHHDITGSEGYLRSLFEAEGIQFVFNYAAYPYIPVSFARPVHVCDVNFMGAMRVINAAAEAGCKGILQVSSAEIYGDHPSDSGRYNETMLISETDPVSPHSSYGVAKAAVDNWVQCRWREAKTPCIALRQFNCVGERETHPYIVPEIIGQLAEQQDWDGKAWVPDASLYHYYVRLGNNSFRDFLYAGDAVRTAVELLERGGFGEVYNLGSETGIKMYDLAKLIGKMMGFNEVQVVQDPARVRPWEIWHLQSDNTKINQARWGKSDTYKTTSLETALQKTIAWYNDNGRKWAWEKNNHGHAKRTL